MALPNLSLWGRHAPSAGENAHALITVMHWGSLAVLALVMARGVAFLGGEALRHRTLALRAESVVQSAVFSQGASTAGILPGIGAFVERNPFGVPPRAATAAATPSEAPVPEVSLADVQVEGTVAGVAALVVTGEGSRWILQGSDFRGYRVFRVKASGALLSRDGKETFLPLIFVGGAPGAGMPMSVASPVAPAAPAAPLQAPPVTQEQVRSAAPGKEGVIARDVVNSLLMNPFDELKRVRLVPKIDDQGKAGGLEIKALEDKSILSTLGVRPGDVIKGINGITMNNMGDVANAINSLMGGNKFEVSIVRDGKPEQLSYAVK